MVIEATDVAAAAGIEEGSELDRVRIIGQAEIPCNIRQSHIDIKWHRRGVLRTWLSVKTPNTKGIPAGAALRGCCCGGCWRGGLGIRGWGRRGIGSWGRRVRGRG